jgi:hypothetical protein
MTRLLIALMLVLVLLGGAVATFAAEPQQETVALKKWTGCPPWC